MSNENEIEKPQQPETEGAEAEENVTAAEKKPAAAKKTPAKKPAPKKAVAKSDDAVAPAEDSKPAVEAKAPAVAEAVPKPEAPPAKEPPPPPPPPEPGRYGQLLIANGFHPAPLGNDAKGVEMFSISANELREAAQFLRDSSASHFDLLVSVSGVDWKDRLEAVYHLYSTQTFDKVVVKATAVDEKLPSVVSVWQTADWHERETYDLFGIVFEGHPNLTRILMPVDWIGYPMRKDYKVEDPRLVWNER